MEEYVVYVLFSEKSGRLYIGYSAVSIERFHWHNSRSTKGFTPRFRPWKMIHIEFFGSKEEALHREKLLKGGKGRGWIKSEVIPKLQSTGFISA